MSTMTLKSLVDKLSPSCKTMLEAGAALCNSRSHFSVEIQHWLSVVIDEPRGDLCVIARHFDISLPDLQNELQQGLERLKTGNSNTPGLSPHIVTLLRASWMAATIDFGDDQIRTAHLIYALLKDESLASLVTHNARQLEKKLILHSYFLFGLLSFRIQMKLMHYLLTLKREQDWRVDLSKL